MKFSDQLIENDEFIPVTELTGISVIYCSVLNISSF